MKKLIVFLSSLILILIGISGYFDWKTQQLQNKYVAIISQPTPTPAVFSEDKLWSLIQKWRTDNGFQPYIKDQRLCTIALDRITNDPPLDNHAGFYRKYGNYPSVISENLDASFNENSILGSWLSSPDHLDNLKKPYTYSCLACKPVFLYNENLEYCAQEFSSFKSNRNNPY